jgi:AraC-like DNA-binding protein
MLRKISEQLKLDPSDTQQHFQDVNIKLFCCRYWILDEWECNDLSVPFWRIYHNAVSGSTITYSGERIALNENVILIIPPNTAFSSRLKHRSNNQDESIKGRKFRADDDTGRLKALQKVDHLFIHFSLGYPLDLANTGIVQLQLNETTRSLLQCIKAACIDDTITSYQECLRTKMLVSHCITQLPATAWALENTDHRIMKAIRYIEQHFQSGINNEQLAELTSMATNSFARLFKSCTGIPVQQYILKLKVQAACNLLHHTQKSFDEISFECGFSDRHHFSKIFKKVLKMNPSGYKRQLTLS